LLAFATIIRNKITKPAQFKLTFGWQFNIFIHPFMGLFTSKEKQIENPIKDGVLGEFKLHELLNRGGMSEIWSATDMHHNHYALRMLNQNLRFDFTAKKRFLRGCEILSQVYDHDHIVQYYDHGKINGTLFLLMECVEGGNLKQLSHKGDPVLTQNLSETLIFIASALDHVHLQGFIHLDFKPENILMTRNGIVKLVDFDLSVPIQEKPFKTKKNPGTPFYMAPEQLLKQPIDRRVDIFSFGVTAYELTTQSKPFPGESPEEILKFQLNQSRYLATPRSINPSIPEGLEAIILKCLKQDPESRYPYMSVVLSELEKVLYVR
jgi:serine/threonine-protein kinase